MKSIFGLLALLTLVGCTQHESTPPTPIRDPNPAEEGAARFKKVNTLLQTHCATCHAAFESYSEREWIASGYVVPGNIKLSLLYGRLRGAGVGGAENMPRFGELTAEDLAAFRDWIQGIPGSPPSPKLAAERTREALAVFKRRCENCHGDKEPLAISPAYKDVPVPAFGSLTTDSDFAIAGLITPKNPETSWIAQSIRGWGSIASMPKNGRITDPDKNTISVWIQKMGDP